MEKLNIIEFRSTKLDLKNEPLNINTLLSIEHILKGKDYVIKDSGLCAAPWDKYYSFTHRTSEGVTRSNMLPVNIVYIKPNSATSTYSKKKLYYSIEITLITQVKA